MILDWLERHGRWGAHYFPLDRLVNKLSHVVRNDGKRIRRAIKDLASQDYVFTHKGGNTISLNSTRTREIAEYIRNAMKF